MGHIGEQSILICDNEELICWALKEHLRGLGYTVDSVGSSADCIARLEAQPPDLLILDPVMPGVCGLHVLDRLKTLQAPVQTLVLSAHTNKHTTVQSALRLGADRYQRKPFMMADITASVAHLLSGPCPR